MGTVHRSNRGLANLTAADIMQASVIAVGRRTPLAEVERLLTENRISGVPVTDEAGHVIGVVSMSDLVEHYAEGEGDGGGGFYSAPSWDLDEEYGAGTVPETSEDVAADIMTSDIHSVDRNASVTEVAKQMTKRGVHRLLVTDGARHIGLVSTTDIVRAVAELD